MNVAVVTPRRSDRGRRDVLWNFTRRWWEENLGWPIVEGTEAGTGPFSIAAARNAGALEAGAWDVLVMLDADVIPGHPRQIRRAVEVAAQTGRMTIGHDRYRALNREGTDRVLEGWSGDFGRYVERTIHFGWSNVVVMPRPLWDRLGGLDERFVGWGFEDTALAVAAKTLGGGAERVHGDVFHLWHEPSPEKDQTSRLYRANRRLRRRYLEADGDVVAIEALLAERTAA